MVLLSQIGNYKCTGVLLGKGSFARVEVAIHRILKTEVALKIIQVEQNNEDQNSEQKKYVLKNLYREATLLSKLSHPCIVTLFETFQCKSHYILVLESVRGGDLLSYLHNQKHKRLNEQATWNFAIQLISAISHMHSRNVIHRDLKMENILLNMTKTRLKIVDFGLSNEYSSKKRLMTFCGSPEYAAPELFSTEKKYGPAVDVWSLGVIIYVLVFGKLPFRLKKKNDQGDFTKVNFIHQVHQGLTNVHHRQLLQKLSDDLRDLLLKLINPNPEKRIKINVIKQHTWVTKSGQFSIKTNPYNRFYEECKFQAQKATRKLLANNEVIDNNNCLFRFVLQYKLMKAVETCISKCECHCCCSDQKHDLNRLIAPIVEGARLKKTQSETNDRLKYSKLKQKKKVQLQLRK